MTTIDRDIARAAMPSHGEHRDIAALLHRLATALEENGPRAEAMVTLLAARGWGSGTLGDGGPRSSDGTSSTERALGLGGSSDEPDAKVKPPRTPLLARWQGKDVRLHELERRIEHDARELEALLGNIVSHGADDDPIPGGTGECACCGRFCRPDGSKEGRDEFRLKAGLCPSCYRAYLRDGQPWPRSDWIRDRKQALTDDQGVVHPEDASGSPAVTS